MDSFDQYLYDEVALAYDKDNIPQEEYEELYQQFLGLDHLNEVKPYLFTMRYFGLGTPMEKEEVMEELANSVLEGDVELCGVYYDLLLHRDIHNAEAKEKLNQMKARGYTTRYLRWASYILLESEDSKMKYKEMYFECGEYSGTNFTAGDLTYLNAQVVVEPRKFERELTIESQIFFNDQAYSDIMVDTYTLYPETVQLKTTGWGNQNGNSYAAGTYLWQVKMEEMIYHQYFTIVAGALNHEEIIIDGVKLFASGKEVQTTDLERYQTTFDARTLYFIYFKSFFTSVFYERTIQIHIHVKNLDDGRIYWDKYILQKLNANSNTVWNGVGFENPDQWTKGLYEYTVRMSNGNTIKGSYTIR